MKETPELNMRMRPRRRRQLWRRTVSVLAVLVVFCTVYALVLPAITLADEPICGQQVHEHSDSCYRHELKIFNCAAAEHVHEGCEDELGNMSCGFGEVVLHRHSQVCYDQTGALICLLPEQQEQLTEATPDQPGGQTAEHLHTPSCYDETGSRICGLRSGVLHVHDETCFKTVALSQPELICKLPEHIHVDACYLSPEDLPAEKKEFLCDMGQHSHTDGCYDEAGGLLCTIPEHSHDASCKVPDYDPTANVETAEDWENTLEGVTLTGNWSADLLAIAQTQLGYRESRQNVVLSEDGSVKGYTRYGAWYGAEYMDWSAAFASFCAHYAHVTALPQDGSCQTYLEKLQQIDLLRAPDAYLPKPGDVVVLNTDGSQDGSADAIGIVSELLLNDDGELTTVKFIQGDGDGEVCYRTCDLLDRAILGYGEVSSQPKGVLLCEQDHDHSDSCYGCKLFYTDDTLSAQVLFQGIRELPEGLTLTVSPVTAANSPAAYSSMSAAVCKQMEDSPYFVGEVSFFDMALTLEGQSWGLPEGVTTSVEVSFAKPVFTPEDMETAAKVETFLLTPEAAPMMRMARAATVSAETGEYQVQPVDAQSYEGEAQGLEGVTFQSSSIGTVAMVLSTQVKEGVFWERLFSVPEITGDSNDVYMIVSAEGNYALRGNDSSNYTQVQIEAQKGDALNSDPNVEINTKYYTIVTKSGGAVGSDLYWSLTKSGNGYRIQNKGSSQYLCMGRVQTGTNWRGQATYGNKFIFSPLNTPPVLIVTYVTPENGFRIANGSNYLRNPGTGSFGYSSSTDGEYNSKVPYNYTRDMLIFKLSDITELAIPKDFKEELTDGADGTQVPKKPEYGEFINPSGEKTGDTSLSDETGTVNGKYYSDPSTSNLEIHYRENNDLEKQKINDGKVMSDKSVIYGHDDYGAFESYEPNTFGVVLSTLGQEYMLPQQDMVTTPIDVVYILDVSGSMSSNSTTQGENPQRIFDLKNAVNQSMKQILAGHEENRVGIAIYSGGAWEMLPLDRYTADNDLYLTTEYREFYHDPASSSYFKINYLVGSSSLKNEAGKSFANVGGDAMQGIGTYTQAGIAMGHKIFQDIGTDTTFTATLGYGSEQKTITVARQPVFILLSDGEPTYSTSVYNDALNGPHYGNGNSGSTNGKGIHGYYTVLSANYYKRMVGIQYQREPMFYSIGIGINKPEDGDGPMVKNSNTGDNYKRAVLNPTKEIIENLTTGKAQNITNDQLRKMLLNTWGNQSVQVNHAWPEKWTGIPHVYEPVLQPNPYTDDYSYADKAFFGYLAETDLTDVFKEIYTLSMKAKPYGFILHENSSIDILDRIGHGMEVKGDPVLRFNGTNYHVTEKKVEGNVTTYIYDHVDTDPHIPDHIIHLSNVRVTVTLEEDGTQSVEMYVPDSALPVYTPKMIEDTYYFYYEQLPLRLIYQVGLTEASETAVLKLNEDGGKLEFYTSQWGTDQKLAHSTLLPSTTNPYYFATEGADKAPYHAHHDMKTNNTTDTVDYRIDCHRTIEQVDEHTLIRVDHMHGNNGKLVFEADQIQIPVEKHWDDRVNADVMNPVKVGIYKVTESVDDAGKKIYNAEKLQDLTLSKDNDWKATAEKLPAPDGTFKYAVAEAELPGYIVSYALDTVEITTDGKSFFEAVLVDQSGVTVSITNTPGNQLPATGGGGVYWYTAGGMALMLVAALLLLYKVLIQRRREAV